MVKALSQKENVRKRYDKDQVWKRIDQSTTRTSVVRRLLIAASVAGDLCGHVLHFRYAKFDGRCQLVQ